MEQTIFTTSHLFREDGLPPQRVHWLRYPLSSLRERASHRRIRRRHQSCCVELADPFFHRDDLDRLYSRYLDSVDFEGYSSIQKATFPRGGRNIYETKALIVKEGERIIACGIFHVGETSLASVLHFYDPLYGGGSPGKFLILKTLDYCRERGLEWYYPGYVIQGNSKMDYKLFLGEEAAQYYDPVPTPLTGSWLPFRREILGT